MGARPGYTISGVCPGRGASGLAAGALITVPFSSTCVTAAQPPAAANIRSLATIAYVIRCSSVTASGPNDSLNWDSRTAAADLEFARATVRATSMA